MPRDRAHAPVGFDEAVWNGDLRSSTDAGRIAAASKRAELERDGQPIDELLACDTEAQDRTSLPNCVKTYEIDAATCVRTADWCLSELIRVAHAISLEEAQALLDAIAERDVPHVWAVAGIKRVQDPSLSAREQVLVLLYSDPETAVPVEDLFVWVEYNRMNNFRNNVLTPLHRARLVEFDRETNTVLLSPRGATETETRVLPKIKVSTN